MKLKLVLDNNIPKLTIDDIPVNGITAPKLTDYITGILSTRGWSGNYLDKAFLEQILVNICTRFGNPDFKSSSYTFNL